MLIRGVRARRHAWRPLFPRKRSLQPVGPSSSTLLGWFRLPPIDQYSSLLPPVGVWTVSQFQCGGMWGTFLSEPLPIVALVGRRPANKLMGRIPIPHRPKAFAGGPCGPHAPPGINLSFERLDPDGGQVGYALLTRAPVAIGALLPHAAPRLACVKPVASVHPEPGSNSSL